jgi:hypothetical protein
METEFSWKRASEADVRGTPPPGAHVTRTMDAAAAAPAVTKRRTSRAPAAKEE